MKFIGYDAQGTDSAKVAVYIIDDERVEVDINNAATIAEYDTQVARAAAAESTVANIPGWATWTEAEALAWIDANVVADASVITVLKAQAQMLLALRNRNWPGLEGS